MDIHPKTKQLYQTLKEQTVEQSFSCDYLLADYLPDMFKILKYDVIPAVNEVMVGNERVTADLSVELRVLYLAEETHKLSLITQKLSLQKGIECKDLTEDACVRVTVRTDAARYRVVNPRRVELKGTLLLKCTAALPKAVECFRIPERKSACYQTDQAAFSGITAMKTVSTELSLSEETPLPFGSAPIDTVLLYRSVPKVEECRLSGDKLVCKGELDLHLLYLTREEQQLQTLEYTVPVDCVMDAGELADEAAAKDTELFARFELIGAQPEASDTGGIDGQYRLSVKVTAVQNERVEYVGDIYSTACRIEKQTSTVTPLTFTEYCRQQKGCKNVVTVSDTAIETVHDLFCDVTGCTARKGEDGKTLVSVNLKLTLLANEQDGGLFCVERSIPVEFTPELKCCEGDTLFLPEVRVVSGSYRMLEGGALEVRTELMIEGACYARCRIEAVCGVKEKEDAPYPKEEAALHLYFAKEGESVWEIAKQFAANYQAVLEENELDTKLLPEDRMLLIPVQ